MDYTKEAWQLRRYPKAKQWTIEVQQPGIKRYNSLALVRSEADARLMHKARDLYELLNRGLESGAFTYAPVFGAEVKQVLESLGAK